MMPRQPVGPPCTSAIIARGVGLRVVFYVRRPIPGLAEAGSHIEVELDDQDLPVTVVVDHGPDALDLLIRYRSCLELVSDDAPSADVLRRVAVLLSTDPSNVPPHRLRRLK